MVTAVMSLLGEIDRRAGARLRAGVGARPGGGEGARALAGILAPSFRALVALLVVLPGRRRAGLEALAASALASGVALLLRDRLDRRRPGPRPEGGFPSRHAAAAAAIARAVWRDERRAGGALAVAAAVSLAARVATGDHEPADIVCGSALGLGADRLVQRLSARLDDRPWGARP
jgi:membrane-associated phospholipid phosphatase